MKCFKCGIETVCIGLGRPCCIPCYQKLPLKEWSES